MQFRDTFTSYRAQWLGKWLMRGLCYVPCEERLRKCNFFSLERRYLWDDPILAFKTFQGKINLSPSDFSLCPSLPLPADQEDGSNEDPSQDRPLGRRFPKQQNFKSKIGRPPFKRRYRNKWGAWGLCAWTPSFPDIYQWPGRWTDMQSFVLRRRRQAHRPKKSATRATVINPTSVHLVP